MEQHDDQVVEPPRPTHRIIQLTLISGDLVDVKADDEVGATEHNATGEKVLVIRRDSVGIVYEIPFSAITKYKFEVV